MVLSIVILVAFVGTFAALRGRKSMAASAGYAALAAVAVATVMAVLR